MTDINPKPENQKDTSNQDSGPEDFSILYMFGGLVAGASIAGIMGLIAFQNYLNSNSPAIQETKPATQKQESVYKGIIAEIPRDYEPSKEARTDIKTCDRNYSTMLDNCWNFQVAKRKECLGNVLEKYRPGCLTDFNNKVVDCLVSNRERLEDHRTCLKESYYRDRPLEAKLRSFPFMQGR